MADNTQIEWTDATWQIVTGCSVVSPGCTNCYAMRLAGGRMQHHPSRAGLTIETKAGPVWNGQVRFNESWLTQPLSWSKPRKIFVAAHGDLFHEGVTDAQLDQILCVMAITGRHTYQILTKRADRMRDYFTALQPDFEQRMWATGILEWSNDLSWPLPNVWLGVSVEDQTRANERVPELLATPAAVRWVSLEPLLGPVDLENLPFPKGCDCTDTEPTFNAFTASVYCRGCCEGPEPMTGGTIDWGVVGGESGPKARPMHPAWVRDLRDQFAAQETPFLFKQWGAWCPGENVSTPSTTAEDAAWWDDGDWDIRTVTLRESQEMHYDDEPAVWRVGKARSGRLLDGVLHDGYPS